MADETREQKEKDIDIPEVLAVLPIRDVVVFPMISLPLFVGRPSSVMALEHAVESHKLVLLVAQKEGSVENPALGDLFEVGTVASVVRMLKLPDGRVKVLIQGHKRARILELAQEEPFLSVRVEVLEEPKLTDIPLEVEALMRNVKEKIEKIIQLRDMPLEVMAVVNNIAEPGVLADLVASNLRLKIEEWQAVLELVDPIQRLGKVDGYLAKEVALSQMQTKLQNQVKEEIDKTQREYFLRGQLKAIQDELGESDGKAQEIEEYNKRIEKAKMPKKAKEEAERQLKRLETMHPDSAEASIVRTYLDWLVELPWSVSMKDNLGLKDAKRVLDEDHYNLEKVKERILEFLAVRKLKKSAKGPILCFVGPPGVGKTSLGKSIARAMGRKFVRLSLGGMRDEAEIRGHRRTYIGAMPGQIVQQIKNAGSNNPVFMLDEVDKIGMDFRGDPSSALLEVLDPEQNHSFMDHYLGVPFDLSKVMFVATANVLDTVPGALRDRMEVISIPGYTPDEKLRIAKSYIVPRQLEANGLEPGQVVLSEDAIKLLIGEYTREAGLRNLEREIASILRKVAKEVAEGKRKKAFISVAKARRYLGPSKYLGQEKLDKEEIGVATGLAWTWAGGEILHVEVSLAKGKGTLTLTGQLGEVMKESAQAALSYARAHAKEYGIDEDFYPHLDIHIHVPAGAIPKDGPSAGVTIVAALISALSKIPVKKDVAMTGEITLRGRVLPVGGIKEKVLGALQAGIRAVALPFENEPDFEEVPPKIRKEISPIYVKSVDEVLKNVLAFDVLQKQDMELARASV
jgi:ATP-dependent Lon protease